MDGLKMLDIDKWLDEFVVKHGQQSDAGFEEWLDE